MNGLLRAYFKSTEPSSEAVARLVAATDRLCARDPTRIALLHQVPVPGEAALARLLAATRVERRSRRALVAAVGTVSAIAAAVAVFALAGPAFLHQRLEADVPTSLPLVGGVDLVYAGRGLARGTEDAPRIHWEAGRIELDIDPATHRDVTIETGEATVRVVGTSFTVVRDALGTTVDVERGRVDVACRDGSGATLGAADALSCWPIRPGALLGRAQALRADPIRSLAALDRALPRTSPGDPIRGEILALRAEDLLLLGRLDEARATATTYLTEGHKPRRARMVSLTEKGDSP